MPRKNPALTRYARSCRNLVKRQYAEDYADYLDGFTAAEPERPANLSYMAAQAVRMSLANIAATSKALSAGREP